MKKMETFKTVLTWVAIVFLVAILVNALIAFLERNDANAAKRDDCPGGTFSRIIDRYPADKRHQPLRLAEKDINISACFGGKGHFNSAKANGFIHRNAVARTLGYEYEMRPGLDNREPLYLYGPNAPTNKIVGYRWQIHASYRQCIPIPGVGQLVCTPDGNFRSTVTLWSDWMVRNDPYNGVNSQVEWSWNTTSGYSKDFMLMYKTP